jgi:protein O-mannosyl-transferase
MSKSMAKKSPKNQRPTTQPKEKIKYVPKAKPFWRERKNLVSILIILAITSIVYQGSLKNGFVNWDDEVNLMENKNLQGEVTMQTYKDIFSFKPEKSSVIGNYNPLPIATFAFERKAYGIKGVGMADYEPKARNFHLVNVILHLICVILVFRFSRLLGLGLWGGIVVALLYGIHPMRVESVAWITERKDVLFGLFYFAALIHYVHFLKSPNKVKHGIFILLYFILSLFSKIQAVSLPLSMLAIDYLFNRPMVFRRLLEKIPYFLLSLAFGLIGVYFLKESASLDQSKAAYNLFQRLFIGSYSYLTYIYKLFVPYPMSPLYPYPKFIPWYIYASIVPTLAILAGAYYAYKKEMKELVFGILFYTFNIMFLLQIVGAGQGFLADRFTYVAYFGLFFIVAYYAEKYLFNITNRRSIGFGVFGAVFLVHAVVSIQQIKIWENGATLWTQVLKYYKNVTLPYGNRANYYRDQGFVDLALADYNDAIRLESAKAATYNSRGKLYFNKQQWVQAEADYDKAIELDPTKGEYWVNRAAVKASTNRFDEALPDVNKGLEVDPTLPNGYRTRFLILQALNRFGESIPDIDQLLKFTPGDYNLYYEKARAYRVIGRTPESIQFYDIAIQGNPRNGLFYHERGKAHVALGNKAQARQDLDKATQLGTQVDPALYRELEK